MAETVFTPDFGRGRYEYLSGAISWLTFFAGGAADVGEVEVIGRRGNSQKPDDLFSAKAEELFAVQPNRPAAAASGASMSGW